MPRQANRELVCIARYTAKPGRQKQLIEFLRNLMVPTLKEKGCIRYEVNQQLDKPRVITLVEKWTDRKAFEQHCSMPYVIEYLKVTAPRLVAGRSVTLHQEIVV